MACWHNASNRHITLTVHKEGVVQIVLIVFRISIASCPFLIQLSPAAAARRPQAQLSAAGRAAGTRGVLELQVGANEGTGEAHS